MKFAFKLFALWTVLLVVLVRTTFAAETDPASVRKQLEVRLLEAAERGEAEVVALFLAPEYLHANRGILEARNAASHSPLMLASYNGHLAVVEQLLAAGADACAQDKRGNTALLGAIFKGETRAALRLIGAPCGTDARNLAGQTPAMLAALFGRQEILTELTKYGADMAATDAFGNTVESLARGEIKTR